MRGTRQHRHCEAPHKVAEVAVAPEVLRQFGQEHEETRAAPQSEEATAGLDHSGKVRKAPSRGGGGAALSKRECFGASGPEASAAHIRGSLGGLPFMKVFCPRSTRLTPLYRAVRAAERQKRVHVQTQANVAACVTNAVSRTSKSTCSTVAAVSGQASSVLSSVGSLRFARLLFWSGRAGLGRPNAVLCLCPVRSALTLCSVSTRSGCTRPQWRSKCLLHGTS